MEIARHKNLIMKLGDRTTLTPDDSKDCLTQARDLGLDIRVCGNRKYQHEYPDVPIAWQIGCDFTDSQRGRDATQMMQIDTTLSVQERRNLVAEGVADTREGKDAARIRRGMKQAKQKTKGASFRSSTPSDAQKST